MGAATAQPTERMVPPPRAYTAPFATQPGPRPPRARGGPACRVATLRSPTGDVTRRPIAPPLPLARPTLPRARPQRTSPAPALTVNPLVTPGRPPTGAARAAGAAAATPAPITRTGSGGGVSRQVLRLGSERQTEASQLAVTRADRTAAADATLGPGTTLLLSSVRPEQGAFALPPPLAPTAKFQAPLCTQAPPVPEVFCVCSATAATGGPESCLLFAGPCCVIVCRHWPC